MNNIEPKELFYGKDFSEFDKKLHLAVSNWKENNQQLLIDNNLQDSQLFSATVISDKVESIIFDDNVPELIRKEIRQLFISNL